MADWKYVMFEHPDTGQLMPVLFPNQLVHQDVADVMRAKPLRGYKPTTAGFTHLMVSETFGNSESLCLPSNEADAQIINTHPYTSGVFSGIEEMVEKRMLIAHIEALIKRAKS